MLCHGSRGDAGEADVTTFDPTHGCDPSGARRRPVRSARHTTRRPARPLRERVSTLPGQDTTVFWWLVGCAGGAEHRGPGHGAVGLVGREPAGDGVLVDLLHQAGRVDGARGDRRGVPGAPASRRAAPLRARGARLVLRGPAGRARARARRDRPRRDAAGSASAPSRSSRPRSPSSPCWCSWPTGWPATTATCRSSGSRCGP